MHLGWKLNWFLLNSLKWRENNKHHPLHNTLILKRLSWWFLCRLISSHNFSSQATFYKSQIFLSHSSQFNMHSWFLNKVSHAVLQLCALYWNFFAYPFTRTSSETKTEAEITIFQQHLSPLPRQVILSEKEIVWICWEQITSILSYLLQPPYHLNG